MTRLEEMVITFFPAARPGVDFDFATDENGKQYISKWDVLRLGDAPELAMLRKRFLEYIRRKSKVIPSIDTSDPAPWLDDSIEEFEPQAKRSANVQNRHYMITPNGTLLRFKN